MRGTDRLILVALPVLAVLVGFWLLVLAPKREEASELGDQVDSLKASIGSLQSEIAAAEAARDDFGENYAELVVLGKAVPEDGDQSTLIFDFSELGRQNDLKFMTFEVASAGGEAPAAPAPATEATAALLPIGATVGPAGLPVTPYTFTFTGNFFDVADFFGQIDAQVSTKKGKPRVNGRLTTIDGFTLGADPDEGFPGVEAQFAVTAYTVPPEQGLAAGATPAGPAPATDEDPTLTSSGGTP